jgi:transposase
MDRKRRRAWVDGAEFGSEKEAAKAAGVSVSTVSDALKAGGRTAKGREISPKKPRPAATLVASEAKLFAPGARKALLRYQPGEGPLYIGLKLWR